MTNYYAVCDNTWPAAATQAMGPFTLRDGQGGGSRVSATTVSGAFTSAELDAAEAAMRASGQRMIFQIRDGQEALDDAVAARGYEVFDPVNIYACPAEALCDIPLPRVRVLDVWEPLALMREIWANGGIGPERLAVMARARGPKTGFLGRLSDKPAGVAFAAIHEGTAMVHAVEVVPDFRRQGMGQWFMRGAALWTRAQGGHELSVICTQANVAANALYTSLGMNHVGQYHYRGLPV